MKKILVTGGCGYIGSHTIVDLIENGFDVISVDNNSRSTDQLLEGIEAITGKKVKNYKVDLCNFDDTHAIFTENDDIIGVIHFAAYKAVGESVEKPLMYFENNLFSLINLLKCIEIYKIPYFVFSSSCTVYGNPDQIPVTEESALKMAESPYGYTKQVGEQMIRDFAGVNTTKCALLRYFNPAGAHPSIEIGEITIDRPQNLTPVITQTAIGKIPEMTVFGNDYPTRDGSCIRDFIHVCDLAHAHTLALKYLMKAQIPASACEVFNLGTGNGISVLEAIKAFESVNHISLKYKIGNRRPGDVVAIYANRNKAESLLGWCPKYDLNDIMKTAWAWELKLQSDERFYRDENFGLN